MLKHMKKFLVIKFNVVKFLITSGNKAKKFVNMTNKYKWNDISVVIHIS